MGVVVHFLSTVLEIALGDLLGDSMIWTIILGALIIAWRVWKWRQKRIGAGEQGVELARLSVAAMLLLIFVAGGAAVGVMWWRYSVLAPSTVAVSDPDWLSPIDAAKKYVPGAALEDWRANSSDENLQKLCNELQKHLVSGGLIAKGSPDFGQYLYTEVVIAPIKWNYLYIGGGPNCSQTGGVYTGKTAFIGLQVKENKR